MPRSLRITLPPDKTGPLVDMMRRRVNPISIQVQPGSSLQPPGDVVIVEVANRSLPGCMRLLDENGIGHSGGSSITTSMPQTIVSPSHARDVQRDTNEATWEEMDSELGRQSNATRTVGFVMLASGFIAAIGLGTNALHLVVAAMLIAPGFEPLVRVSLGLAARSPAWRRGVFSLLTAYGALLVGAAAAAIALRVLGKPPMGGEPSYLPAAVLVDYWTTISWSSTLVTVFASIAGTLLVASNRAVLTAGVMVALALIPSATLAGMALVTRDWHTGGGGILRFLTEVLIILIASYGVMLWKRAFTHGRDMMS